MKKLLFLFVALAGCTIHYEDLPEELSLSGEWKFRIDSLDQGIEQQWALEEFDETVTLPGSMAENGKGNGVSVETDWTGDIIDRSYFTDRKYEKYRQPGNIKIPFWLQPVKHYSGVAWYQKDFDLPGSRDGKRVMLFLERCHWESTLFVNGNLAGSRNSLATPHKYDISDFLNPGDNLISIRIDNRVIIPVGVNSHSITDHTQTNWNGITGEITLKSLPEVFIDHVKITPDVANNNAKVVVSIKNTGNVEFKGKLRLRAESFNSSKTHRISPKNVKIVTDTDGYQAIINYKMRGAHLWSEFTPSLYRMSVELKQGRNIICSEQVDFGMRSFRASGSRFEINGMPVFLRGTLECCIFPLTGYPPSDVESWEKVFRKCRDHGLNHIRFHSWCPPRAAFRAADKLGFYLQVECSSWANQGSALGDGSPLDRFIYEEGDRILREYGNHPSFCMLAYGNEPAGDNQNEFLGGLLQYWKSSDEGRVYTSAGGWPFIPENDYHLSPDPRIQRWGEGLNSIINSQPPQTIFDYSDYISQYSVPVISHEAGQWCVYPDFSEIGKYTGVLKPSNLEIFRETLEENGMGQQAGDFLMASGKLQALCYKAEIEAALRTPGLAGFQLLQLHDFPGQGTALVGVLNPFFESKGYITPEEFRMFCSETVPLARIDRLVYTNTETFNADLEIFHFGPDNIYNPKVVCRIINSMQDTFSVNIMTPTVIEAGKLNYIGSFATSLKNFARPQKLYFEAKIEGTAIKNGWEFWVYPAPKDYEQGGIYITDRPDSKTEKILNEGGSVLLMPYGKIGRSKGAQIAMGFSSIFWNTAWTNNQPPHTLGILCDPENPAFSDFPTEYHSNWQWWDPVVHSQAMIIDGLPSELKPLMQPVDTWFENRRLALAFESKTAGGRLLVCSIDLKDIPVDRLASGQLLKSLLKYINSEAFDPVTKVDLSQIRSLMEY